MTLTPFPRPFYRTYAVSAIITGLSIAFILAVLQPFGTSSFQHEYKYPILIGYGVVIALSVMAYYYLSLRWFNSGRNDNWTIVHELVDYLVCIAISMSLTYLYYISVFGYTFRWSGLRGFLSVASAVNTLPMIGLGAFMYLRYRDVIRSNINIEPAEDDQSEVVLSLRGSNKSELIETTSANILFVKAEDNYVIVHLLDKDGQLKKHMIRSTMKDLLAQLPQDHFVQCHRSYIVNTDRVLHILGNKNSSVLKLRDSAKQVPVGRSKYELMKNLVLQV